MTLFGVLHIERPLALVLALPWLAFWWWFAGIQRRACRVVWDRVDPRAWRRITVFRPASLRQHLALLSALGLLLVLTAARPTLTGETEARPLAGRVVLLFDASASMYATDGPAVGDEASGQRFEAARRIAQDLVAELGDYAFAVVTYSGEATLQLPMTADRANIKESLRVVEVHNIYRRTGSHFGHALDRVVHFAAEDREDLQAVILSDGEQPSPADFSVPLAALAERAVAVHGVAIGSEEGQDRRIFDFRDVVAGKEERRVLREYTTRRVDRDLASMAKTTGGTFTVAGPGTALALALSIRERHADAAGGTTEGRRALAPWLLGLFLVGFLLSAVATRRGDSPSAPAFDLDRLGPPKRPLRLPGRVSRAAMAILALISTASSCRRDEPRDLAARENERGIAADALGQHAAARVSFERSFAFGILPEIPTFNLARSLTRQGSFSEAHDVYQRALELEPRLAPAHYNDGWALFLWGEAERDPRGCVLDRTLELWTAARDRFASAAALYDQDRDRDRARTNLRAMSEGMAELERLIAEPPEACLAPAGGGSSDSDPDSDSSSDPNSGGDPDSEEPPADNQNGSGEDGTTDPDAPPPGGAEPPPPGDADSSAGGGPTPLSDSEREQIARAIERIRGEAQGEGTYHRRSLAEQFPADSWQAPDAVIWW